MTDPKRRLRKAAKKTAQERAARQDGQPIDPVKLRRRIRKGAALGDLCEQFDASPRRVREAIKALEAAGVMIARNGDHYHIADRPQVPQRFTLESDAEGVYRIGLISDTHLGSTSCRYDVLEDAYDWFAAEGIRTVYGAGNWIEGIARFNRTELEPGCATWDGQLRNFLDRYPRREGITSYWVSGDDHEGWLQQREGIDVGRWMEDAAREAGRDDLVSLGYVEAFIRLQRKGKPRASAKMLVQHPGGGSSYAISYLPQKLVESLQPGEKPAVLALGHVHKSGYFNVRGVHVVLVPSTKDQDTFHRKKRLDSHIGCVILELRQDERGAIYEVLPRFRRYFDRSYYSRQFELPSGHGREQV